MGLAFHQFGPYWPNRAHPKQESDRAEPDSLLAAQEDTEKNSDSGGVPAGAAFKQSEPSPFPNRASQIRISSSGIDPRAKQTNSAASGGGDEWISDQRRWPGSTRTRTTAARAWPSPAPTTAWSPPTPASPSDTASCPATTPRSPSCTFRNLFCRPMCRKYRRSGLR